jgi:hypothetical protein
MQANDENARALVAGILFIVLVVVFVIARIWFLDGAHPIAG